MVMKRNYNPAWAQDDVQYVCECGYCGELFNSLQEDDTVCPHCAMLILPTDENEAILILPTDESEARREYFDR